MDKNRNESDQHKNLIRLCLYLERRENYLCVKSATLQLMIKKLNHRKSPHFRLEKSRKTFYYLHSHRRIQEQSQDNMSGERNSKQRNKMGEKKAWKRFSIFLFFYTLFLPLEHLTTNSQLCI